MGDATSAVSHVARDFHIRPSEKYSDLTIECEGVTFPVHRVIVCSQSPVLDAAWQSPFIESKEATYKIREFSADVVAKAIDFMYTGDYLYQDASEANNIDGDTQEPPKKKRRRRKHRKPEAYGEGTSETVDADKENRDPQEGLELLLHGKVNCLGDYLNIPALCELAIHKIDTLLKESWDGARSQFPQFLDLVCESAGDKNLHSTAARLTVKHLDDLVKDNIFEASRLPPCFFANVFQSVRDEIQGLKADAERSRDEKRELEGRLRKVDDLVAYSRKQRKCVTCSQRLSFLVMRGDVVSLDCGHCSRQHIPG